jgi:hypothetical protein
MNRRAREMGSLGFGLLGILLAVPTPGHTAGIRDLTDGWLLGPAAVAAFLGPPLLSPNGTWLLAGQSRLFGRPELPVAQLQLGLRVRRGPGQPSLGLNWQSLGEGLYQERQYTGHLQWGKRPVLGLEVRSLAVRSGGALGFSVRSDTRWQVAVTAQVNGGLGTAAKFQVQVWLPVVAGGSWSGGEGRQPLLRLQWWGGPTAAALAVDLKEDQTPTAGAEWWFGHGGAAWGLRVDPATGTLGPVVSWRKGSLLFRSSHLAHPQLGVTHRVQVGWGSWGAPRW